MTDFYSIVRHSVGFLDLLDGAVVLLCDASEDIARDDDVMFGACAQDIFGRGVFVVNDGRIDDGVVAEFWGDTAIFCRQACKIDHGVEVRRWRVGWRNLLRGRLRIFDFRRIFGILFCFFSRIFLNIRFFAIFLEGNMGFGVGIGVACRFMFEDFARFGCGGNVGFVVAKQESDGHETGAQDENGDDSDAVPVSPSALFAHR